MSQLLRYYSKGKIFWSHMSFLKTKFLIQMEENENGESVTNKFQTFRSDVLIGKIGIKLRLLPVRSSFAQADQWCFQRLGLNAKSFLFFKANSASILCFYSFWRLIYDWYRLVISHIFCYLTQFYFSQTISR